MDLNEAAVLVKVIQAGGFSAAARLLGVPTSTVSTRVARLEKRLGVTLIRRTTRRLALTDAGELYYQHAAAGLAKLLDAEAAVTEAAGEPSGLLRVTAPADLGDAILGRIMHQMRRQYPKVRVELALLNTYADLVAEGLDVAIRTGELQDSTLIAKNLGIARWVPFASPAYLASRPRLDAPEQLDQHCCLQFTPLGRATWTLSSSHASVRVPLPGEVLVNDVGVLRAMTLAGEGVALLPIYLCRQDWDEGRLVRLLPGWQAKADPIQLLYPRQSFVPAKVRAFIELASMELGNWLEQA